LGQRQLLVFDGKCSGASSRSVSISPGFAKAKPTRQKFFKIFPIFLKIFDFVSLPAGRQGSKNENFAMKFIMREVLFKFKSFIFDINSHDVYKINPVPSCGALDPTGRIY